MNILLIFEITVLSDVRTIQHIEIGAI